MGQHRPGYHKEYYAANKERLLAQTAAWYADNKDKIKVANRNWHQAHKEHCNRKNLAWAKANPAKACARVMARYAKKLRATPVWADTKAIQVVYTKAHDLGLQVDHIVPLNSKIVCGLHTWHNLQLLEPRDNYRKGNHHWPDMP